MVRQMIPWTPVDISHIYWMVTWGYKEADLVPIVSEILKNRTPDSIKGVTQDIRKFLMEARDKDSVPKEKRVAESVKKKIRLAAKIPPTKEIEVMKQVGELVPVIFHSYKAVRKPTKPNFPLVESNLPQGPRGLQEHPGFNRLKGIDNSLNTSHDEPIKLGGQSLISLHKPEEPDLLNILKIAKLVGAEEVHYKDYIIKFKV